MTTLIKELTDLAVTTKRLRAEAMATLREMDTKDLAKLEDNNDSFGYSRLVKKVHNYPTDLSIPRLVTVLKLKEELGL